LNVGICKIKIRLPENQTLKGKRSAINSICHRIRNKFNVSISIVDDQDTWQLSTIGISYVSNDTRQTNKILNHVIAFLQSARGDIEFVSSEQETLTGF